MATTILMAPKIKCEGCAQTITQALAPVPGVQNVQVDIERKKVTVNYEPGMISVAQIKIKLGEAGFLPA
jgi:copper chaperone CopZ